MAHVRKRKGAKGRRDHWDARWDIYVDGKRKPQSKSFDTKSEASEYLTKVGIQKPSSSDTFDVLSQAFLNEFETAVKAKNREATTLRQYTQHVKLHILPDKAFATLKCKEIGTTEVQLFLDRLYARDGVSPTMTGKVRTTLSQIFSFGARRGFVSSNPVRDSKVTITTRPEIGEDGEPFALPPKDDLRRLMLAAKAFDNTGKAEAFIRCAMYAGLRSSEQRGLSRRALSLDAHQPKLTVDQRADAYNKIGRVKSKSSRRDIVLGKETVDSIKRWLDAAPKSELVFPSEDGTVLSYQNLWNRFWVPLMNKAGLVKDEPASNTVRKWSKGQAEFKQPRFGFHMLRHVYASLQIEIGVQPKRLQALMGHSTLKVTMDTYGHLWPDPDGDKLAASVESALG